MGGTTPNWQIPYPTGTDRVVDGDNAIQASAERVDSLVTSLNTSVIALEATVGETHPYNSAPGNAALGWGGDVAWAILSGWVNLRILLRKNEWGGPETMCFLPSIAWPKQSLYMQAMQGSGAPIPLVVTTAGQVECILAGSYDVYGTMSYPIGV